MPLLADGNVELKTRIDLTDTQEAFCQSDAPIVWLIGSQGEGKTFAGFIAMLVHAQKMGKTVKAAIVRDTFQNIKTMTIPSIQDAIVFIAENYLIDKAPKDKRRFLELFKWSDGGKKLTGIGIDVDLFGIDDLGALTKLQGGEYSFIWLEEPAPMFERANAGLSEEVFTASLSRVARQRGAIPRLQITMNPADEDHWTHKRAIENPIMRPDDMPDIYTEVFFVKYGENPYLTSLQRQVAKAAFKDNPSLYRRYVEGEFAFVSQGEAVTPEYDPALHRSPLNLEPYPNVRGIRFYDSGHMLTCVIAQIHPITGRLIVYDTFTLENAGMIQLIRGLVKPAMATKYKKVYDWIDTGDPALIIREMTNTEMSPAKVIERELNTRYIPGVNDWATRVQAIKYVLTNQPLLLLSKNEELLHKALRGGWHYAKSNDGRILRDKAVKDRHSHASDAISQGLPRIINSGSFLPLHRQKEILARRVAEEIKTAYGFT